MIKITNENKIKKMTSFWGTVAFSAFICTFGTGSVHGALALTDKTTPATPYVIESGVSIETVDSVNSSGTTFTIESLGTLQVDSGVDVTNNGVIDNNGVIINSGYIINNGTIIYHVDTRAPGYLGGPSQTVLSDTNSGAMDMNGSMDTGVVDVWIDDSLAWQNGDIVILHQSMSFGDFVDYGSTTVNVYDSAGGTFNGGSWGALYLFKGDHLAIDFKASSTPIPEPGTYALMGGFALMTILFSRKREKKVVTKAS